MIHKPLRPAAVALATLWLPWLAACAADWPAHKADARRSSVTAEALAFPLAEQWAYEPGRGPAPAWPEPGKELHRVDFDYAFQPVVAGGLVYFGSSADDTVYALSADIGEVVWRFVTEGPVRFAPAIARGRVYAVSDDGCLYCLDAKTGKLAWRFRAAPGPDRIVGNGRLISRHPCRSGALVVDRVVYITAGMWPTEGVYVYALDADTGAELWCNDSSGSIYIDLPHAVASGFSAVAPQGYLIASGNVLLVPTGRSVPAAFDRRTGRLLYYKPEKTHYHGAAYGGGVWCTAAEDLYFHPNNRFHNPSEAYVGEADPSSQDGMIVYSFASGDQQCHIRGKYRVLVHGNVVYAAGNGSIDAVDLSAVRKKARVSPADVKWTTPHQARVYCLAMAGPTLLTGNRGCIAAFSAADGKPVWRVDLEGDQVRGMAVAGGRLLAATQRGTLRYFGPGKADAPRLVKQEPQHSSIPDEQRRSASAIAQQTGKSQGYALVLGEPDTQLAEAIASQTQLHVVSMLPDASRAAAERERLLAAGLLGSRVAVHVAQEPTRLHLPHYFADVVVASASAQCPAAAECYRVLRPCGGKLCLVGFDAAGRERFVREAGIPRAEVDQSGAVVTRGKLPGSAEWRYPWADGGRTGIGKEGLVRFPLELLWFGGPGPDRLLDRHLMPSPPVSANGRVFMQGQHHVVAFDAYNGRELWSREVKGVGRKYAQYYSASLVADDDSVYVVQSDRCHRLDQCTGKTLRTYTIPESVISGAPASAVPDYVDAEWPQVWHVIGPFPKGKPPLSAAALAAVPEKLTVKGGDYTASQLRAVGGAVDFTALFGGYGHKPLEPGKAPPALPRRGRRYSYHDVGRICYAFAKIDCPRPGKLLVGAGADWGMQWFVDGKLVFDALRNDGSAKRCGYFVPQRCSPTDRLFDVDVTAGEHVLAVVVTAGSRGWALATASMAKRVKEVMPVAAGANPNVPNLRDLAWGYLSATDDLLLGSYNVPVTEGQPAESHLLWRSESKAVFALNKSDGALRWVYGSKPDRIVANIEIAFADGRMFLIDGTSKADLARARRRKQRIDAKLTLVALNLADGSVLWRQDDVPLLGDRSMLSRLKSNITHLFMGQPSWGHLVCAQGVVVLGANAAYDAATGKKLWQKPIRPGKMPLVYGDRLITAAYAYDLRTGEQCTTVDELTGQRVPWRYHRSYGCGPIAGCQNVLFFRSGADGFFDMEAEGTTNFGGVRSGCARTLLAANGLLIHPQGYSGCCCSYSFKSNLALIAAPGRAHTWYVFPALAREGAIKRLAVNFGAPGDQRDSQGHAWLGFPRPMLRSACPAPVTVSMDDASCYYRRRATAAIQGAEARWVYSSGLRGQGRVSIELDLQPNIVLPLGDTAPAIDGKLDDTCWPQARSVPFQSTAFSMLAAGVELRVCRDREHIYFGYRRKPLANPSEHADKATLGRTEELDIFIVGQRRRTGIRWVIKRNGTASAWFGTVGVSRKTDPSWKGEWKHAVGETPGGWTAELALPIKTLTDSGIQLKALQLNCMSQNLTQSGVEAVFLTDPYYGSKFRCCCVFVRVATGPATRAPERSLDVRLHFAETAKVKVGQRVFDVLLQGKPVLRDFDVLREAGGPNAAVVKEFTAVRATDRVVLELVSRSQSTAPEAQPQICGIEIMEHGATQR